MKFLETITFMGNDTLIPIRKIKFINVKHSEKSSKITIQMVDECSYEENFSNHEAFIKRYNQIKKIIHAK